MENNLAKEDMDFINKLIIIDKSILEVYKNLALLEYKKRFGTDEYNEVINKLSELIKLEKSIYNIENLSSERIINLFNYLEEMKEKMSTSYEEGLCFERISGMLDKILVINKNIIETLGDFVQTDLNRITLSLFNDYIEDKKYLRYKKNNIIKKYDLMFIFTSLEEENIKNKFELENEFSSSIDLISKYMNVSEEIVNQIKIDLLGELFLYNISIIKNKFSTYIYDNELYSKLLCLKCMSKATLILLPDMATCGMEANLLKGKFSSDEELNFFKEIFEEVHDDKKRMIKVSFGRNRG